MKIILEIEDLGDENDGKARWFAGATMGAGCFTWMTHEGDHVLVSTASVTIEE